MPIQSPTPPPASLALHESWNRGSGWVRWLACGLLLALLTLSCWSVPTVATQEPAVVGAPFECHGEVIAVEVPGQGLVMALKDQNVAVHGLGPLWFWDAMGWSWPMVGDTVIVSGHAVTFGNRTYRVAEVLNFDGRIMRLRDPETGLPKWHGQGLYVPLKEERP